jgi:exosome complex component RRP4
LIIVDVQNCFITGNLALVNNSAHEDGTEVVPIINKLIQTVSFDLIVYTHDWHPANHISFFENLQYRRQYLKGNQNRTIRMFDTVTYSGPKFETVQVLWPSHCIQRTDDAKLHKDLIDNSSKNNTIHIYKGTNPDIDSYSAFWDNEKHKKTELNAMLNQWRVTRLFIAGLATDYCVGATAIDAKDLNYTTYLVEDACRGVDNATIAAKKEDMKNRGIVFIQSNQVKPLINSASYSQIHFTLIISFFCLLFIY